MIFTYVSESIMPDKCVRRAVCGLAKESIGSPKLSGEFRSILDICGESLLQGYIVVFQPTADPEDHHLS
jgi:hypothetical protein